MFNLQFIRIEFLQFSLHIHTYVEPTVYRFHKFPSFSINKL